VIGIYVAEIQGVSSRHVENSQVRCKAGVHSAESPRWLKCESESVDLRNEAEASTPQANRPFANERSAKAVWRFARRIPGEYESGDTVDHEKLHPRDQLVWLASSRHLPRVWLAGGD